MKFAHIADTHIRNLKYHTEYRVVFDQLYEELRKENVDYIIHCGDICHTKTQISPEFVQMCSDFFRSLSDIAPTYIILGNHDGNLRNPSRQDSISPIISALERKNLHLLKNSGEVSLDDKFTLNVLSVFDTDNWIDPTNPNKINIALHHGTIAGCETDTGWVLEGGEYDVSIFDKFDFAMLGDVHKTDQRMDKKGSIRYPGSTIQQNFGEDFSKGFLLWDIHSKASFTVKHIPLQNPKPFISVVLNSKGKVPESVRVPDGARVRLIAENKLSISAMRKAVDVAKKKYNPESVSFITRTSADNGIEISEDFTKDDLRDIGIQEKFIREYLEDYNLNQNLDNRIMNLNKKYNSLVEEDDASYRNINFKIVDLEWDNLFNYGERNKVTFADFDGIVGIFGKNFSGKSSIIDSLLYVIFNAIAKNSRKNLNIINNARTEGQGKVRIKWQDKMFTIERKSEKYIKRLKGNETIEAKTTVDFKYVDLATGDEKSLNGLTRSDTDKNIVKYFGTMEDFLLTSMSSQDGAMMFIGEGSTKRKEILAKFLDLELLDKKFRLAKDDATIIKSSIRQSEQTDYAAELKKFMIDFDTNKVTTANRKAECEQLQIGISQLAQELGALENKINSAPTEIINIVEIRNQINTKKNSIGSYREEIKRNRNENQNNKKKIAKVNKFLISYDADALNKKKQQISDTEKEYSSLVEEIRCDNLELQRKESQASLLKIVPCGPEFSHCKFISHAYEAANGIESFQLAIENNNTVAELLKNKMVALNPEQVENDLEKFNHLLELKKQLEDKIPSDELLVENYKSKKSIAQHELKNLQSKEKLYEQNREVIENLEGVINQRTQKQKELEESKKYLAECEEILLNLYKNHGYYEQRIERLEERVQDLEDLRSDYEAYDLFMKVMHPNGIAYDIIKNSLPVINNEISKILANIVSFQIFFETDDNRLDIYIQHPDRDPSPLEMASGAEKTVAAMAIRLAFTNISTLPKSQLFVLDEPGTALDEERMEGFVRILDITKSVFKTVLLISHLDSLKDSADSIISIENKDGFAYVWS
jgi:DNA repair exonuclease SbcCD ATPase subunit/DNA repair exonuclease SbcCD nuclease subunit